MLCTGHQKYGASSPLWWRGDGRSCWLSTTTVTICGDISWLMIKLRLCPVGQRIPHLLSDCTRPLCGPMGPGTMKTEQCLHVYVPRGCLFSLRVSLHALPCGAGAGAERVKNVERTGMIQAFRAQRYNACLFSLSLYSLSVSIVVRKNNYFSVFFFTNACTSKLLHV